jgi:peptide/nickel transport system substrate-binding protein
VLVRWKQPYIDAERLFAVGTSAFAQPLPKHLLQAAYLENKAGITDLPYWTTAFVGTGPFKVKDWVSGSHLVLEAVDGFTLGRPKLDEIEIRFILDSNTLVANVLAGEIDLTLGRGISIEQALQVRDQWRGGRVDAGTLRSALNIWPQLLNPSPAVVSDVRFRRAMFYAIDRQAMVDNLQGGLTQVVESWIRPSEPEFRDLERNIVRYPYDARRAIQEIEGIGYSRGPDGVFRDAEGQRLGLEFRTITGDINQKTLLAVSDNWQQAGVAVDQVVIPSQRQSDLPYRATFPAFELLRGNTSIENANNLHSGGARLPENGFRGGATGGTNYSRYSSAQLDAQIDRFFATIPRAERMQIAGQIVQHMTEQVLVMGMFYDLQPAFVGTRLRNLSPMGGDQSLPWNAHEWDVN